MLFAVLVMMMFMVLVFVALAVVLIIGKWKVFTKAGEPGWASIIPFYSDYILCKIVGVNPWWILIAYLSPILNVIPFLGTLAMFAVGLYYNVLLNVSLARSYGKEDIYALGLILLNPIFMIILGFDKDEYQGAKPMDDFILGSIMEQTKGDRFCTNCGHSIDKNVKFCPYCGKECK